MIILQQPTGLEPTDPDLINDFWLQAQTSEWPFTAKHAAFYEKYLKENEAWRTVEGMKAMGESLALHGEEEATWRALLLSLAIWVEDIVVV